MMAISKLQNEGEPFDLSRCEAKSDVQQEISRRQRAMLEAAAEDGEGRRWTIVKIANGRDNDVDNLLYRAAIEHWLPLRIADENVGGRRRGHPGKPVWELAWPGYLFVKIADTAMAWHGVSGVKHVKAVLGVEGRPFFMDDAKLMKIKAELATLKPFAGPRAAFEPGHAVRIGQGPFAGHNATFTAYRDRGHGDERASVEVMIFGRVMPIEIDLAFIEGSA